MPPDANPDTTRVRRRLALALIAVAILLALLITPPLVNVDRYRHRIAQTMSDSLGRPVHIDDVKLHLLPMPSLELRNVVVSEDPAFGSEPTIRANRVDAILWPSSLWRRRIEFSTIRFAVDENGAGPSVNLVRNAAGRWNLDSVFMQAAHVTTAPTAQPTAGPKPRFPYIEATAARVNLKLGEEKMPFSLTETDFALWLPEPNEWHVRIKGRPIRTDMTVSETGLLRVDGTLQRAASMGQVPANLQASWTGAQLGGATALLTGQDMGWRGTSILSVTLRGPLADAQLTSTLNIQGLRRTDFIPARMLDLTITCQAHATVTEATLEQPACSLPAPAGDPQGGVGQVQTQAARFDLTSRSATDLRVAMHASNAWVMDWARLLSPTIPADENPQGSVVGNFAHVVTGPESNRAAFWNGVLQGKLMGRLPWQEPDEKPSEYDFTITGSPSGLDLAPVNLAGPADLPLALTGNLNGYGYSLHLTGFTTPRHLRDLAQRLPPLGAGLDSLFPQQKIPTQEAAPQHIDIGCSRQWAKATQTCAASSVSEGAAKTHPSGHRRKR